MEYLPPYSVRLCGGSSLVSDLIFRIAKAWLMRTSGTKPLSAFGLIHKIPIFKPVLEDERKHGRYPNLLSDDQSDGGLLDYVHDHFVDLEPFESNRAGSARSDSDIILLPPIKEVPGSESV